MTAVLQEIEELEEKMIDTLVPKRKTTSATNTNSKSVEIVSELARKFKNCLDEIEKGKVAKPKNFQTT